MASPKDILVSTTSSLGELKVKRYLKPVSAHIVAGTNVFSDFFASFSDVFGGRSQTYQKQLRSLYNEATERIRQAAYEIGANAVIGLSIDMDEISGKNKSMFMLTAIGTAVIIENDKVVKGVLSEQNEKVENVTSEKISSLQKKKLLLESAANNNLVIDEAVWTFISSNQVKEIFPYIITKYREVIAYAPASPDIFKKFNRSFIQYLDSLPEQVRKELLYKAIDEASDDLLLAKLCEAVDELNLLDFEYVLSILNKDSFSKSKLGLRLLTFDKPFYNRGDIEQYNICLQLIAQKFGERGERGSKKGLLSSKEKEIWNCDCGKGNIGIGDNCPGCMRDISGFLNTEVKPHQLFEIVNQKIEFIEECVQ